MPKAETNETQAGAPQKSRLLDSDAPVAAASAVPADEPQYTVGGKSVTREEYIAALPKAGYVPDRMPANFYPPLPAVDTK